jgi:hypothetical protein
MVGKTVEGIVLQFVDQRADGAVDADRFVDVLAFPPAARRS